MVRGGILAAAATAVRVGAGRRGNSSSSTTAIATAAEPVRGRGGGAGRGERFAKEGASRISLALGASSRPALTRVLAGCRGAGVGEVGQGFRGDVFDGARLGRRRRAHAVDVPAGIVGDGVGGQFGAEAGGAIAAETTRVQDGVRLRGRGQKGGRQGLFGGEVDFELGGRRSGWGVEGGGGDGWAGSLVEIEGEGGGGTGTFGWGFACCIEREVVHLEDFVDAAATGGGVTTTAAERVGLVRNYDFAVGCVDVRFWGEIPVW